MYSFDCIPLLSGAAAGLSVDFILFPVDTLKTRLQSRSGFFAAGGFRQLYSGIGSVVIGSMPGAAVFFAGYEATRHATRQEKSTKTVQAASDILAASLGEVLACMVRVPVEVVKQRAQINTGISSFAVFRHCLENEGWMGLYRGFKSTIMREIPFSVIQFPLWEFFKSSLSNHQESDLSSLQSGGCGFVSGGVAAAVTTPLDVVKTRIMLASKHEHTAKGKIISVLLEVSRNEGATALFSGMVPRVITVSVGGFIFLGMYDFTKSLLTSKLG